ncbi:MAG: magnesium transporter [Clostridia bacterium]|nr:magnesium transporter [Clostridia bacterium]
MTQDILNLIETKDFKSLKVKLADMLVPDIANVLEEITDSPSVMIIFRLLPKDLSAEVFSYINSDAQEVIVQYLSNSELSFIMEELATDDAVDFIEEMPANIIEKVLRVSNPETRKTINKFLSYQEDTAGAIMTPEFVKLNIDMTVEEAIDEVRRQGEDAETVNVLYVTDGKKVLKGVLTIKELILANKTEFIKDIMEDNVVTASTDMDQEKIASLFSKYDFLALPVIDKENRIVGIVTVDDIIDVIKEETTEDFEKMAAVHTSDDTPYLKTPPYKLAARRFTWLGVLLITGIFTSMLISAYEATFASISALICLLPMLMGTSGNAGTQISTIIIRALSLKEVSFKDYFKVFFKELWVSLILGALLALIAFGCVAIQYSSALLGLAVALPLIVVVFVADFLGFSLPILAKKLKLDPALIATPILTTILDCCVVFIYFNFASWILTI